MTRLTNEEEQIKKLYSYTRESIELDRCIIEQDEDGTKLYTIRILDSEQEGNDRNNILDIEDMEETELLEMLKGIVLNDILLLAHPSRVVSALALSSVIEKEIQF